MEFMLRTGIAYHTAFAVFVLTPWFGFPRKWRVGSGAVGVAILDRAAADVDVDSRLQAKVRDTRTDESAVGTGTLTIAPGETMKTITIEVKSDSKK